MLSYLPLHHVAANAALVWPALLTGARLAFAPFTASHYFDIAAATGATFTVVNATHVRMVTAKNAPARPHRIARAATGFVIPPARLAEFESRYGMKLLNTYGFTECLGRVTSQRHDEPRTPGLAGRPIGGRTVRIRGPAGDDCAPGEVDEIVVSWESPAEMMLGYLDDGTFHDPSARAVGAEGAALNVDAMAKGSYASGDLGRMHANGELEFLGRATRFRVMSYSSTRFPACPSARSTRRR